MSFGFSLFEGGISFNSETDIPDLSGKVFFVTGGDIGLGRETVLQLAHHRPSHIYLSACSEFEALAAITDIQLQVPSCPPITFINCDLASFSSIQLAARDFIAKEKRLDVLILNASIAITLLGVTEQGYEIQFGTNYVGHALITKLLLPTLLKTARESGGDARVVCLSSAAHAMAPRKGIEFDVLKTDMARLYTMARCGQSKLANILFAKELARRYKDEGLTAVSLHPGDVDTETYPSAWAVGRLVGLTRQGRYNTVQDSAKNQLWAATAKLGTEAKRELVNGEYYTPVGVGGQGSRLSTDCELAHKLWEWTEVQLKEYIP